MVKIIDVKITTEYRWSSVFSLGSWGSVKHSQPNWGTLTQTSNIGGVVKIEVEAKDPSWLDVKLDYLSWSQINSNFVSWETLKDYNERK